MIAPYIREKKENECMKFKKKQKQILVCSCNLKSLFLCVCIDLESILESYAYPTTITLF